MGKNNIFDFTNKTIIIAGGFGLIGSESVKQFALLGGNVVIAGLDEKKAKDAVPNMIQATHNTNISFYKCDIHNTKEVRKLIKYVKNRFTSLDIFINSSFPKGKTYGSPFEEINYKDFCANTDIHLGGFYLMMKEISDVMKKQKNGKIVNIASIYGVVAPTFSLYENTAMVNPIEYAAIKYGIIGLTKYLASYLGPYNVQVNCVSPGGVFNNQPEQFIKRYNEKVPLGRMATPGDIAGGVLFLSSDLANYITGQNLIIDGGFTIC